MGKHFEWLGNFAGILGMLLCLMAGGIRITGDFYLFGYAAMTIFNLGIALMVAACLAKLHGLGKAAK
jgi:hypothetical protein